MIKEQEAREIVARAIALGWVKMPAPETLAENAGQIEKEPRVKREPRRAAAAEEAKKHELCGWCGMGNGRHTQRCKSKTT